MPWPERTSIIGIACCCVSSSTIRSSSRPVRSWTRSLAFVVSREASGDLGLPDAGRADHNDVLRRDLVPQLGWQVLAPPAVAQRDRHRAFCPLLADDVAVQLRDDLRGGERQLLAHRTSTLMWSLVYTQIEAAMRIASVTIPLASRSECATSARAAASAYGPPEPMPISPSSGSMTSPF